MYLLGNKATDRAIFLNYSGILLIFDVSVVSLLMKSNHFYSLRCKDCIVLFIALGNHCIFPVVPFFVENIVKLFFWTAHSSELGMKLFIKHMGLLTLPRTITFRLAK